MNLELTSEEKAELELRHESERDKYICDRIKAVLLASEGWSVSKISQALRLHRETISRHLKDFERERKLSPDNGGSSGKLDEKQSEELIAHLEVNFYEKASAICAHVLSKYKITYTVSGMTAWLKSRAFSYKKPKEVPAKADAEKQKEFLAYYAQLKTKTPKNEPILFIDSVHPTMQTKLSYGWIRTGENHQIPTTASRTRINITGAIELSTMNVINQEYEKINGDALVDFFALIKKNYQAAPLIHIVLDNAGYHRNQDFQKIATRQGFKLHFLPPYSPNLNPIERLWKVMNEEVRNNKFFPSAKEFREAIRGFFKKIIPSIGDKLVSRINDNFHVVSAASSF